MKKIILAVLALCCVGTYAQKDCCGTCKDNPALEKIMTRTSIRKYQEKAVPDDAVEKLLRAAMAAPTAVNRQPWHFVVVTNAEMQEQLGGRSKDAPLTIVVCGDMDKAMEGAARDYWVQDCSAATENLLLAAHALGLGAVWQGVYPIADRVKKISGLLKLDSRYVPLSMVAIGYPEKAPAPKDKWKPENVEYVK